MELSADIKEYQSLLKKYQYDLCRLVYIVFPFGEKGSELEHQKPYRWQMEEWAKLSKHLQDPLTRYKPYKLNISSGNGAAKTSFMAMTYCMLTLTQRVRGRVTANTEDQMRTVTWVEFGVWFRRARYMNEFFELLGESITTRDNSIGKAWQLSAVTWDEKNPVAMSGLHNMGYCIFLAFDEAAGIPAVIWEYASGAMSDAGTIKIWFAVGNSDDPNSKFEQNMTDPSWHSRRIDTRELDHVDKDWVNDILVNECGGDEDHDIFRVRVRGLPRKSAEGSLIKLEQVQAAFKPRDLTDPLRLRLPSILSCDPAWQGGDETVIAHMQGAVITILERYKLKKNVQDHSYTYGLMCKWERALKVDRVFIDQAEGTTLKTLATQHGKYHWTLVPFGSSPNDMADSKDSEYANMRAMMHYRLQEFIVKNGGHIQVREPEWKDEAMKQMTWAKEERHKQTGKKKVQSKAEIKTFYGKSPDINDAAVLCFAEIVTERLPEHETVEREDHHNGPMVRSDDYNPNESLDKAFNDI